MPPVGGACWAFIVEKHRLILFGTYPYDEQWRPLLATIILIAVIVCSGMRRFWKPSLALVWIVGLSAVAVLMWGGVLGLTYVENARWGRPAADPDPGHLRHRPGVSVRRAAGPGPALAHAGHQGAVRRVHRADPRRAADQPAVHVVGDAAAVPARGFSIDKLLRAQIAIIMFAAAYIAETVRGGLQAIPKGQYEGRTRWG